MKRASQTTLIENDEGLTWGIVLHADFTAEHEWGIAHLADHMRIGSSDQPGLTGRMMEYGFVDDSSGFVIAEEIAVDETLPNPSRAGVTRKCKGIASLLYCYNDLSYSRPSARDLKSLITPRFSHSSAESQWDGRGFCITAYDDTAKIFLRDLRDALLIGDVAVWLGGYDRGAFSRGGLIIAIASRVPEAQRKTLLEADKDAIALKKAADATGIVKRLDEARQKSATGSVGFAPYGYFALSPRWVKEFRRRDDDRPLAERTAHPVIFWLNPYHQNKYESGWFTVEELDQWIAGTGPIIKP